MLFLKNKGLFPFIVSLVFLFSVSFMSALILIISFLLLILGVLYSCSFSSGRNKRHHTCPYILLISQAKNLNPPWHSFLLSHVLPNTPWNSVVYTCNMPQDFSPLSSAVVLVHCTGRTCLKYSNSV